MLELRNIDKSFHVGSPDEFKLFSNFNLKVERGEYISIVGSNGSGKTTLLNLFCGRTNADKGEILYDGKGISSVAQHKRFSKFARVFQNPAMGTCPGLTIAENMALAENKGKSFGLSLALDAKKKQHYKSLLAPLELKLEEKIDSKVETLSGGQRQALALLMTELGPVDCLFLDEHTAALDPKTAEIIMRLTNKLVETQNLTCLMVTHNLRFALEYGNRLIMLHEGKIVLDLCGDKKKNAELKDLLSEFDSISIESGN